MKYSILDILEAPPVSPATCPYCEGVDTLILDTPEKEWPSCNDLRCSVCQNRLCYGPTQAVIRERALAVSWGEKRMLHPTPFRLTQKGEMPVVHVDIPIQLTTLQHIYEMLRQQLSSIEWTDEAVYLLADTYYADGDTVDETLVARSDTVSPLGG